MDVDAQIIISTGNTLRIVSSSNLYSCDQVNMWKSIDVGTNSTIIINGGSTIRDAEYAISTGNSNNPTIQIDDAIFNKNYVAINVMYSLSSNSSFKNVNIQCQSSINSGIQSLLLYPYNSVRSFRGLFLRLTPYFQFTSTLPDRTFIIKNVENGFVTNVSSFKLEHARFNHCGLGVSILSPDFNSGIEISNNAFGNCGTCISGSVLSKREISIINNIFDEFKNSGINLYNTANSEIHIVDNLFNSDVNPNPNDPWPIPHPYSWTNEGQYGIYIHNFSLYATQQLEVTGNNIVNCRNSIALQNISWDHPSNILCAVSANHIELNETHLDLYSNNDFNTAIWVENCRNVGCSGNFISRPETEKDFSFHGLERERIFGINYTLSQTTNLSNVLPGEYFLRHIVSNQTWNISNSVWVSSVCTGVGIACNTMHDAYYDITLDYRFAHSALISQQPPWSFQSQGNSYDDINCLDQDYRVNGNNAAGISDWYYVGAGYTIDYPTNLYCFSLHPLLAIPSGSSTCPDIQPDVNEVDARELLLGKIVRGEIQFENNASMFNKYAREFAFRTLIENNSLLHLNTQDDSIYNYFYNQMLTGNAGLFLQVEELISQGDYTGAYTVLSSIIPEDNFDSLKLTCYNIIFHYDLQDMEYDSSTIATLTDIAYSDYFTSGEAVFMARGMLGLIIYNAIDVYKIRKNFLYSPLSSRVSIHPNPASNSLTVILFKSMEPVKIIFRIYDQSGKIELEKYLYSYNNTFDIANIPAGIHYYSISNEIEIIESDLLIITR